MGGRNSVVECQLPKLDVAGSTPVARSNLSLSADSKVPDDRADRPVRDALRPFFARHYGGKLYARWMGVRARHTDGGRRGYSGECGRERYDVAELVDLNYERDHFGSRAHPHDAERKNEAQEHRAG